MIKFSKIEKSLARIRRTSRRLYFEKGWSKEMIIETLDGILKKAISNLDSMEWDHPESEKLEARKFILKENFKMFAYISNLGEEENHDPHGQQES